MIETPQLISSPAQLVAAIHIETSRAGMRQVMGPGISEAMSTVKKQGIGPTGPWFAHHHVMTSGAFSFDICVPVSAPVEATGRVKAWQKPLQMVLRTVHHGPYEGLAGAWHEFGEWVKANGYKTASDFYECYLVGPESSSNPADWRTELSRPMIE
jgi:effector-binding domain-containing protein